jgi:hypothetical protein
VDPGRAPRHHPGSRGIVLLFVLWILAGCAFLLAVYAKESAGAPALIEQQLAEPLRWRELDNALAYGLWHLGRHALEVDSDWAVERVVASERLKTQSGSSQAQQIKQLVEMLDQMGFKIDIDINAAPKTRQEVEESIKTTKSNTVGFDEIPLYAPRVSAYTFAVADRNYALTVFPMTARPNLRLVDQEALERLLRLLLGLDEDQAETLAATIVDWRDEDSATLTGSRGDGSFRFGESYYAPPGPELAAWKDLAFMPGMTPDLLDKLRETFVLHGTQRGLHPDYAAPQVIAALADLDVDTVTRGVQHIMRPDETEVDRTLAEIIGDEKAGKLTAAVSLGYPDDAPVLIRLEDDTYGVEVVALRDGTVLERRRL